MIATSKTLPDLRIDRRREALILAAMSLVLGLVVLDETVVGFALPVIRDDLGMSLVGSHWVVNAYLLALACCVALGGWSGDRYDMRGPFLVGIVLFGGASLICGLAPTGPALTAGRALQGVGAALLFPISLAILTNVFPPERRGIALGIQTAVASLFMSAGPLLSGAFTEFLSWRWIFLINVPLLLPIAAALWLLPARAGNSVSGARPVARSVDVTGPVLLIVALLLLVLVLMEGGAWGWTSVPMLALAIGAVAAGTAFARWELRHAAPLFDLSLLRLPTFVGANLSFFVFQWEKLAVFVFVPVFLQAARGYEPVTAGLLLTAAIAPVLVTSHLAGRIADRLGSRRPLLAGLAVQALALLAAAACSRLDVTAPLIAALVVWGAGMPVVAVSARRALMGSVPADRRGQAAGINLTLQMVGGAVGVALCTGLYEATGSLAAVLLLTAGALIAAGAGAWGTVEGGRPA